MKTVKAPSKSSHKASQKAVPRSSVAGSIMRGRASSTMTSAERSNDLRVFGAEIRQSRDTAIDFLKRAGIITKSGKLA